MFWFWLSPSKKRTVANEKIGVLAFAFAACTLTPAYLIVQGLYMEAAVIAIPTMSAVLLVLVCANAALQPET